VAFDELQQIAGRLDPATGEHDALNPLTVASYLLDNVAGYAREVTKLEPTAREILVEHGINPDLDQKSGGLPAAGTACGVRRTCV